MSTPTSRLSTFRSYSYYHVLAMCDSSATADLLSQSTDPDVWGHATPSTADTDNRPGTESLGPYSPKRIGSGKYIVLINGATDASYVISSAKWSSATAAGAVPGDRMTSIAVEGSLQISEPKGIAFLDQVVKCSVALGVDSSQVVYTLKTFFVGHHDTVHLGDYIDTITDVPPITLIVYDVTGSFTEAGGSYDMQFVGAGHGATRLPQYSRSVNALTVTAGDSLELTLKKLQDNINENYDRYFNCVYQQVENAQGAVDTETLKRSLRKVKYVIEVGPDYRDGTGQVKYTVSNQPQQFKNTAGCGDNAQISFPSHTSIETAISQIMLMSPQVLADMAQGDTSDKVKYEYKVHSALISTPAGDTDEGTLDYTVYYRIERFMTPKTIAFDPAFQTLSQDDAQLRSDPNYDRIRRNILEFDYLYTGKNTDILEFDMKVNMGLAYLQTAVLSNTFKSQLERSSNVQMQPSSQDVNALPVKFGGAIVQIPVFFGSQIKTPALVNAQNAGASIQSAYTLTKHASLEVAEANMTIIGNDLLLGTTNVTTSPEFVVRSAERQMQTTNSMPEANFQDWSFTPAYVKIRIKMPRENDDFALFTGTSLTGDPRTDPGATDYAREFWFDGYYYVYGIDHIFDNGVFTQQLHMVGIPKKSAFDSTRGNATTEINMSSNVGACYENQVGNTSSSIAPTNQPTIAIPHIPPTGDTTPTNRPDTNTAQNGARSPSDVRGWDTASPAVKSAIIDAANRYGVDPVVLAQFAAKESAFNPNAKSPSSSATGLFQFITSTWNGLVKQGKVQGLTTADPDERLDPVYNSYGGAAYLRDNARQINSNEVGDLYLAHFLGPNTAAKVISSDNNSGGKEYLTNVIGSNTLARIVKANPTIVKPNTTVGELRDWAAKSMAKTLKNPVALARQQKPPASTSASGSVLPSPNPQNASRRRATEPVAAIQSRATQEAKKDVRPCGPTANIVVQDKTTQGGQ